MRFSIAISCLCVCVAGFWHNPEAAAIWSITVTVTSLSHSLRLKICTTHAIMHSVHKFSFLNSRFRAIDWGRDTAFHIYINAYVWVRNYIYFPTTLFKFIPSISSRLNISFSFSLFVCFVRYSFNSPFSTLVKVVKFDV